MGRLSTLFHKYTNVLFGLECLARLWHCRVRWCVRILAFDVTGAEQIQRWGDEVDTLDVLINNAESPSTTI